MLHGAQGQLFIGGVPNTICPIGPFALSLGDVLFSSGSSFRKITRTCIDTIRGRRCFYTYIPECAGKNASLVYDMHGFFSCPFASSYYSGWKELADEKCMVIMWPTVSFRFFSSNRTVKEIKSKLFSFSFIYLPT